MLGPIRATPLHNHRCKTLVGEPVSHRKQIQTKCNLSTIGSLLVHYPSKAVQAEQSIDPQQSRLQPEHAEFHEYLQSHRYFTKPSKYFSQHMHTLKLNDPLLRRGQFDMPCQWTSKHQANPKLTTKLLPPHIKTHGLDEAPTDTPGHTSKPKLHLNNQRRLAKQVFEGKEKRKASFHETIQTTKEEYMVLQRSERWIQREQASMKNCINKIVGIELLKHQLLLSGRLKTISPERQLAHKLLPLLDH